MMLGRGGVWIIISAVLWSVVCGAERLRADDAPVGGRPRIGLVLSGGGARGAAHIGVIKVLEEMNVPIDYIAGTSMGAIIGGLYAAGLNVEELTAALRDIEWKDAFHDSTSREELSYHRKQDDRGFLVKAKAGWKDGKIQFPKGLVQGQKLNLILKDLTMRVANVDDFDRLRIPFRAVATDLATGDPFVIGKGNLATALRASMSIPGALEPVEIEGKVLVDGGVSNNLPIDVVREMGAGVVIAVSIGTPLSPTDELKSVFAVTGQLTTIMTMQNTMRQIATLAAGDILIEPDLGDITTADFTRALEAIPIGARGALKEKTALAGLSRNEPDFQHWQAGLQRPGSEGRWTIDFIEIDNDSGLSEEVIRSNIRVREGEYFDAEAVKRDIRRIYGLDVFQRVDYEIVRSDGQSGIRIMAKAKEWGPDYVQFGLNLESDSKGDASFNIGAGLTRTAINSLGGEWRTEVQIGAAPRILTKFYQPLNAEGRYFVEPLFRYMEYNLPLYEEDQQTAEFRVQEGEFALTAGSQFGDWGELRMGYSAGWGRSKVSIGEPEDFPMISYTKSGFVARFSGDTLDNLYFPHLGSRSTVDYYASIRDLGADSNYQTLSARGILPFTRGDHTVIGGLLAETTLSGDPEVSDLFSRGGFLNLSGLSSHQITGRHSGLGEVIYYYRIDNAKAIMTLPTYVGGSLEIGGAWEDLSDIEAGSLIPAGSLFVGVDTFFGPIYLAGGMAEGNNYAWYLYLGTTY
ncbi:patatin-like phospholipase family protein [Desulfococcus sp.]|uniref:patatin-like phospholipase family protein n=1 Tax=Desulfococcus sp. TaxID=2025834 RepID=UPI00359354DB